LEKLILPEVLVLLDAAMQVAGPDVVLGYINKLDEQRQVSVENFEKVRPRSNVFQNDGLEIAAGDAIVVDEYVVAMVGKVLENRQPPSLISAAIANENRVPLLGF
jgi:hypothetical protein